MPKLISCRSSGEKGFTRDQAQTAMRIMLRLKVAKLDIVSGRISVKHRAFLESDVIRTRSVTKTEFET